MSIARHAALRRAVPAPTRRDGGRPTGAAARRGRAGRGARRLAGSVDSRGEPPLPPHGDPGRAAPAHRHRRGRCGDPWLSRWPSGARAGSRVAASLDDDARWCARSLPGGSAARSRGGAESSSGTSTSRPAVTSRSRRTTPPRRSPRTTAVDDGRRGGRRAAGRALRQLARRSTTGTLQLRVTKKGRPLCTEKRRGRLRRTRRRAGPGVASRSAASRGHGTHDRPKARLLPEDDPVLRGARHLRRQRAGQAEPAGEVPPGRGVPPRASTPPIDDAIAPARCRTPTDDGAAARWSTSGCGNAYLTFAAHRYLSRGARAAGPGGRRRRQGSSRCDHNTGRRRRARGRRRGDVRPGRRSAPSSCDRCRARRRARAARLRHRHRRRARPGGAVAGAAGAGRPVLPPRRRGPAAGPVSGAPAPYSALVRDGILRERFADTLTDALRPATLRLSRATGSTSSSSSRAGTRRATPCSARCAPAPARTDDGSRRARRAHRELAGRARGSQELLAVSALGCRAAARASQLVVAACAIGRRRAGRRPTRREPTPAFTFAGPRRSTSPAAWSTPGRTC